MRSTKQLTVVGMLVGALTIGSMFALAPSAESQASGGTVAGYAWSDTIGWISLNCSNHSSCGTVSYGLQVDADGVLSGKAWSENIGWVSADITDLLGCPDGGCSARFEGDELTGWLKALSGGSSQSGGWDGFISLSGSSPSYGPTLSSGTFSGYAWGDTNVGWIDFSFATSDFVPDVCLNLPGVQPAAPSGYYEEDGQCLVQCNVAHSCLGQTIQKTEANCAVINVTTCVAPLFCVAGSAVCLSPSPVFNPGAGLSGHLQARPLILPTGARTRLHWDVGNVESCSVTGSNGDSWSGVASGASGQETSPILQVTTFTLTCVKFDEATFSESVSVTVLPVFREI